MYKYPKCPRNWFYFFCLIGYKSTFFLICKIWKKDLLIHIRLTFPVELRSDIILGRLSLFFYFFTNSLVFHDYSYSQKSFIIQSICKMNYCVVQIEDRLRIHFISWFVMCFSFYLQVKLFVKPFGTTSFSAFICYTCLYYYLRSILLV